MTQTLAAAPIVVRCFFDCGEVVDDPDPRAAHVRMEQHYDTAHGDDLLRILEASGFELD